MIRSGQRGVFERSIQYHVRCEGKGENLLKLACYMSENIKYHLLSKRSAMN